MLVFYSLLCLCVYIYILSMLYTCVQKKSDKENKLFWDKYIKICSLNQPGFVERNLIFFSIMNRCTWQNSSRLPLTSFTHFWKENVCLMRWLQQDFCVNTIPHKEWHLMTCISFQPWSEKEMKYFVFFKHKHINIYFYLTKNIPNTNKQTNFRQQKTTQINKLKYRTSKMLLIAGKIPKFVF